MQFLFSSSIRIINPRRNSNSFVLFIIYTLRSTAKQVILTHIFRSESITQGFERRFKGREKNVSFTYYLHIYFR